MQESLYFACSDQRKRKKERKKENYEAAHTQALLHVGFVVFLSHGAQQSKKRKIVSGTLYRSLLTCLDRKTGTAGPFSTSGIIHSIGKNNNLAANHIYIYIRFVRIPDWLAGWPSQLGVDTYGDFWALGTMITIES